MLQLDWRLLAAFAAALIGVVWWTYYLLRLPMSREDRSFQILDEANKVTAGVCDKQGRIIEQLNGLLSDAHQRRASEPIAGLAERLRAFADTNTNEKTEPAVRRIRPSIVPETVESQDL